MTDEAELRTGRRAVTVLGPSGPTDLLCPATTTVVELARTYAQVAGLPTLPLLYARDGEPLAVSATLAALAVDSGDVLVATTGVVRHAPPRAGRDGRDGRVSSGGEGADQGFGGDRRRRGRRRRDVVSTRDGTRPRRALRRGRAGG